MCGSNLFFYLTVYISQKVFHSIYQYYWCCRYPGNAVGQLLSNSAQQAFQYFQAEPEPTLQSQKALYYLCNLKHEAGRWENTKDYEMQGKALHAQIRQMRKRKIGKKIANKLDPCRAMRSQIFDPSGIFYCGRVEAKLRSRQVVSYIKIKAGKSMIFGQTES